MYTIEDLRNGKCAVINDGTLEELKEVLKLAFPEDNSKILGMGGSYFRLNDKAWLSTEQTDIPFPKQSVKDFLNQINKPMKEIRVITWQQAKQIIDIACTQWAQKLAVQWAINIVLGKDIEILEEFYREMRDACTDAQHKLFDEIFGKDVPECPYKDGEPVWVTNEKNVAWSFRYSTGKINEREEVVCYEAQRKHGATSNWKFHMPFNPNNLPVNE